LVWIKFAVCILIIFFSGKRVAKCGDIIAKKTGLGGVWIGLVLVAMITSLPELFTGVSAITLVDAPDLTIGNLLGANAFNMFNLALLDIIRQNSSLLATAGRAHQLTVGLSLLMMLSIAGFIFISQNLHTMEMGWFGWYSPFIIILYIAFIRIIFQYEKRHPPEKEKSFAYGEKIAGRVYFHFVISAIFIIGAGIWLAFIGDEIDMIYGWGESFVGSLLLAFTTTLPEMSVSYAAMRIGATDLAIANMLGSNLYNMTIISIDDFLYLKGPVLAAISPSQLVTALTVTVMTMLLIVGLHSKPRRWLRFNWLNTTLVLLFLLSAYFSFTLG